MSSSRYSMWASCVANRNPLVGRKAPGESPFELGDLRAQTPTRELGQDLRLGTCHQAFEHLARRQTKDVAGDVAQFDSGALEGLLESIDFCGTLADHRRAIAR